MGHDPEIEALRAQIAALDRRLLETLNARLLLVRAIKAHKEGKGLGFHDTAQEARILVALAKANLGPLPDEGLDQIFRLILDWSKRAAADGEAKAD